jgi:hypothetical protein
MSWLGDLGANLKKIVLIEHKLDSLADEVRHLRTTSLDHAQRLVRIETMIEMARERRGRSGPVIDDR